MTASRQIAGWILLLALAAAVCAKDQTLEDLKARIGSAPAEERSTLCVHIAQEEVRAADKAYNEGNVDQARAALTDIVAYSEKARDAAIGSKKHLKNVEIAIRKMSEKLGDMKRTLNFEDQPPVAETIRRLEDIRTTLLGEMFKKERK